MKSVIAVLLLALGTSALRLDVSKERPVTKVINMLKDMSAQLEREAELDEEAYEKMGCYCETNDKEKTKSISDAEQHITDLMSTIEMLTAKSASLNSEVSTLNGEIGENTNGLAKATGIRTKERAEFVADEKSMITSISGLKSATTVLGKHNSLSQESFAGLSSSLKKIIEQKLVRIAHKEQKAIKAFLQQPANAGSYAPQSGQIFGVLQQMKESFESNLASASTEEKQAEADFASMKAAKTEEINAAQNKVTTKNTEIADADEKNAAAKEDLASTRATLAADSEFLSNLKQMCAKLDAGYADRTKTRTEEIQAVSETIGILTDDDSHDLFSKTLGFIQLSMRTRRVSAKELAAKKVMAAAKKAHNPRLAALAVSMRLDAFGMVREKVQNMIDDLIAEKGEEIKFRDQCTEDLHQNDKDQTAKYAEKDDVQASIDDLSNTLSNLKDEVATLKQEITSAQIEMKRASEDREIENKDFQETVADQRATQAILTKAVDRLKEFYANKALVQLKAKAASKQDPGSFNTYKKNEKSGGVMAMIQGVIDDSKNLETEAIAGEQDSQTAYETFISDSNKSIAAKTKSITEKTASIGMNDEALVTAQEGMKATMADLESLNNIGKQLHYDCDFVLKNFELRQEARDQEVEALRQSVAMLSGAKFSN